FGGVATGNIKAHDAATAAPTINTKGCKSTVIAIGANTGKSMAVVAKFEVISVKKLTAAMSNKTKINVIIPANSVIWLPIHKANPLLSKPLAIAIPPPKSKIIPQGNLTASSQFINCCDLSFEGIKNNTTAKPMAIMVSSNSGNNLSNKKERVIQKNAVVANTAATIFSS